MTGPPSPEQWRSEFPALRQQINGQPLIYLDTAATALRPRRVIDAVARFSEYDNANPGAALHTLARRASEHLEGARRTVAHFIGASDPLEVVFTRGTTDGINLVAQAWSADHLSQGDEILIGLAEHSSNMLPWQHAARRHGAALRTFDIDDAGLPRLDDLRDKITPRTRIVAFSHVSNVLGLVNPVREMCEIARAPGRIVLIDAAQSAPHFTLRVPDLGCDFVAFSSHKMLGPMGVGVLWGRRELLERMSPYQWGSNMAHDADLDSVHLSEGALKFGAGTPNVSGPVGLAAAIGMLSDIGFPAIRAHEEQITRRMLEQLQRTSGVGLLGGGDPARSGDRIGVFSFTCRVPPLELVRALDAVGIAVRAGDLASLPLLRRFGARAAARASTYLYTTLDDVDAFADRLRFALAS